jgi:hypothetical protein
MSFCPGELENMSLSVGEVALMEVRLNQEHPETGLRRLFSQHWAGLLVSCLALAMWYL